MSATRIYLIVDNLKMGGIQRLALDESYALSRQGINVEVIVLQEEDIYNDIREIDGQYFLNHQIVIHFTPSGKLNKIKWLQDRFSKEELVVAICHSAAGIGLVFLACKLNKKKVLIVGFLHQVASLSSIKQRIKRYVYFTLAHQIRASSKQFLLEFEEVYGRYPLYNKCIRKKIVFDRMGIDLERIIWKQSKNNLIKITGKPALLFNSRTIGWKGFETFVSIANFLGEKYQYIVVTTRDSHDLQLLNSFMNLPTAQVFNGVSVAHFDWEVPTIHIYPTNYGIKTEFPQSIGLNVLECMALGIPNLISREGFESWPEFRNSSLIQTVDWTARESVTRAIELLLANGDSRGCSSLGNAHGKDVIGIDQHIIRLMQTLD